MPHEGAVRAWLARSRSSREDIDDMIQEAYCRFAALDRVDHIERPDAYFFSSVRNMLVRRLARAKVVPIVPIAEIGDIEDDTRPSPERSASGRLDYAKMLGFLADLPERRRRIVELRKLEGKSQREIATLLGVSENVVEHEIRIGLLEVQRAWRTAARSAAERMADHEAGREHRA